MRRGVSAAVLTLTALATPSLVQGQRARPEPAPAVAETLAILSTVYPELQDERVTWTVSASGGRQVLGAQVQTSPFEAIAAAAPVLVRAMVTVDDEGRMRSVEIDGLVPDTERLRAARGSVAVQQDPEDGLRAAGAKVPPSASARSETLLTTGLRRLLQITHAESPRFLGSRTVSERGAPDEPPALLWEAQAAAKDEAGREVRYTLSFEPFEGRLVSVVRR